MINYFLYYITFRSEFCTFAPASSRILCTQNSPLPSLSRFLFQYYHYPRSQVINDDDDDEGTASGGEEGGQEEDNGKSSSSSLLPPPAGGPSSLPDTATSCSSMAPSTPSAETEASEASTTRNSPKADKEKVSEAGVKVFYTVKPLITGMFSN